MAAIKLLFITLLCFNSFNGNAQKLDTVYIFKIGYSNKSFPGTGLTSFFLIKKNLVTKISNGNKITQDTIDLGLIDSIEMNGGDYISKYFFNSLEVLGCCEYGSNDSLMLKFFNRQIPDTLKNKYFSLDSADIASLKKGKGVLRKGNFKSINYRVVYWKAIVEYCLCNPYLEAVPNYSKDNLKNIAYIKKVKVISKPNKSERIVINNEINSILIDK